MDILYRSGASVQEAKIAAKYFSELVARKSQAGLDNVHSTEDNNRLIAQSFRDAAAEAIALARKELTTGEATDLGDSVADLTQRSLAQLSARGANVNGGFRQYRSALTGAAQQAIAQPQRTIRVDIGSGTNRATVFAENDAAVKRLVSTLEQSRFRTG